MGIYKFEVSGNIGHASKKNCSAKNLSNTLILMIRPTEADFSKSDGLRPLQLRQSNFRQFLIMNN